MDNCCCLIILLIIIIAGLTCLPNNRIKSSSSIPPPIPPPIPPNTNCICNENMRRALQVVFEDPQSNMVVTISINGLDAAIETTVSRLPGNYDGSYLIVDPPISGQTNIPTTMINGFTITSRPDVINSFTFQEMTQIFPTTLIPAGQGQQFTCSPNQTTTINQAKQTIEDLPRIEVNTPQYLFNFTNPANTNVANSLIFIKQLMTATDLSYEGIIFVSNVAQSELPTTIINSCYFQSINRI